MRPDTPRARHPHRRLLVKASFLILMALIVALVFWAWHYLGRNNTVITNSPASVTKIGENKPVTKTFDEGIYTITLLADWRYVGRDPTTIYHPYIFENTASNPGVEQIDVYVDTIPSDLAVNRELPVHEAGSQLTVGDVSDNCAGVVNQPVPNTVGQWEGVRYICDRGNYERDVVGTSSPESINSIVLTGATQGSHQFFFTYTDNSKQPDYTIFTDALNNFRVK